MVSRLFGSSAAVPIFEVPCGAWAAICVICDLWSGVAIHMEPKP